MSTDASLYPIRPITEDELPAFNAQDALSFNENPPPEQFAAWNAVMELPRTMAAFDDGEMVSTGGAFSFDLTVPGAVAVPAAGVTLITVKPTHRRRGLLSAMMRFQLHGWHERGEEPVAILTASEPAIYGRYGYALGTQGYKLAIRRGDNGLSAVPGTDKFRLRLVDPGAAYDRCAEVFEAGRLSRPGMLGRYGAWREIALLDSDYERDDAGPLRCVLGEAADGTVAAYGRYRVKDDGGVPGRPSAKVQPVEVQGRDLASYIAIWRYLLDIDLTDEVLTFDLPTDDPLLFLLSDVRAAQPRLRDDMYVRLVDVDRALAVRRYAQPVDVVFEVTDGFCPWNAGRWRLTGDASGAVCERTSASADLLVGIRELAEAYLGGTSLAALGRAGRVEELTPGALGSASRAFVSDIAPWLPFGF